MKFQRGNKLGKGGKRNPPGGRPSKDQLAIREEVKRRVQLELEKHVMAIIGAGRKIATGVKRKKFTAKGEPIIDPETGKQYFEIEYDGATIRSWVDKFVADAAKDLNLNVNQSWDKLVQDIEAASREEGSPEPEPPAKGLSKRSP
jgi:hypothetical protein